MFRQVWLICFAIGFSGMSLGAQAPRAVFQGKVVDAQSGDGLPGATLQKGKEVLGLCGPTGEFRFELEQAETLVFVRYVGYTPQEVLLRAGDSGREIRLKPEATALDAMVVTGSRYGKRAA